MHECLAWIEGGEAAGMGRLRKATCGKAEHPLRSIGSSRPRDMHVWGTPVRRYGCKSGSRQRASIHVKVAIATSLRLFLPSVYQPYQDDAHPAVSGQARGETSSMEEGVQPGCDGGPSLKSQTCRNGHGHRQT